MTKGFKSIQLDTAKCVGCTNCMKKCPTQAIRVRQGKASINYDKCISCGNCVRACPSHAISAQCDGFDTLGNYKFNVALAPSCLFAQFPHLDDPDLILNGLYNIGFDHVYETARASDLLSLIKRETFIMGDCKTPAISTVCPACVELILTKYQCLKDNLVTHLPPLVLAAKEARAEARELSGLPDSEIGVFYISPCPAKAQAIIDGFYSSVPELSGALSVSEVCKRLQKVDKDDVVIKQRLKASSNGIAWSTSGGEAASFPNTRQLAADGIDNCISILRELEDGKLENIDFVELHACHSGCVGGVFNVINTFIAKSKIHTLRKTTLLNKTNSCDRLDKPVEYYQDSWEWQTKDVYKLDSDITVAMDKMEHLEKVLNCLPRLDCGVCGSPNCRSFAEDVVQGLVDIKQCVMMRLKNDK
ncbi:MAG: [Fe-Fe] hydrogenase large subunit C-terminal domain-containing protein [Clostridia bacterium]